MFDFIGHNFVESNCLRHNNIEIFSEVALMFYEVKVFDSRGQLKKIVSSKKLSNRFWQNNDTTSSYYEEGNAKSDEWSTKNNVRVIKSNSGGF